MKIVVNHKNQINRVVWSDLWILRRERLTDNEYGQLARAFSRNKRRCESQTRIRGSTYLHMAGNVDVSLGDHHGRREIPAIISGEFRTMHTSANFVTTAFVVEV